MRSLLTKGGGARSHFVASSVSVVSGHGIDRRNQSLAFLSFFDYTFHEFSYRFYFVFPHLLQKGSHKDTKVFRRQEQSKGELLEKGTVKWFDNAKGFGFVTRENGGDLFVHYNSIVGEGYRMLKQGEAVTFNVEESNKGFQAIKVTRIENNDREEELSPGVP